MQGESERFKSARERLSGEYIEPSIPSCCQKNAGSGLSTTPGAGPIEETFSAILPAVIVAAAAGGGGGWVAAGGGEGEQSAAGRASSSAACWAVATML